MKARIVGSQLSYRKWALCVPILLFVAAVPVAFAQCSQATLLDVAPSTQSPFPAESAAQPGSAGDSSSGEAVRFATGTAVTVLEGTPLQVMNDAGISSRSTKAGARIAFTVTRDVVVNGVLVIPCGASVFGTVVEAKQAGRLVGASNLTLQLTAMNLGGRSYPLYTPPFKVISTSKTRPTMTKVAAGATVGAIAMDIRTEQLNPHLTQPLEGGGRAFAAGVGAALGAGAGTATAAMSPPSIALIPAESQLEFTLASPIAIFPVDQATAARLARGMHKGGPVLYVHGESQ